MQAKSTASMTDRYFRERVRQEQMEWDHDIVRNHECGRENGSEARSWQQDASAFSTAHPGYMHPDELTPVSPPHEMRYNMWSPAAFEFSPFSGGTPNGGGASAARSLDGGAATRSASHARDFSGIPDPSSASGGDETTLSGPSDVHDEHQRANSYKDMEVDINEVLASRRSESTASTMAILAVAGAQPVAPGNAAATTLRDLHGDAPTEDSNEVLPYNDVYFKMLHAMADNLSTVIEQLQNDPRPGPINAQPSAELLAVRARYAQLMSDILTLHQASGHLPDVGVPMDDDSPDADAEADLDAESSDESIDGNAAAVIIDTAPTGGADTRETTEGQNASLPAISVRGPQRGTPTASKPGRQRRKNKPGRQRRKNNPRHFCTFPKCGKSYSRSFILREHIKRNHPNV